MSILGRGVRYRGLRLEVGTWGAAYILYLEVNKQINKYINICVYIYIYNYRGTRRDLIITRAMSICIAICCSAQDCAHWVSGLYRVDQDFGLWLLKIQASGNNNR